MNNDVTERRSTRDQLLDAAAALIADRRSAASARELAARANLAPSTIYEHFASKTDAFDHALIRRLEARGEAEASCLGALDPQRTGVRADLRAVLSTLLSVRAQDVLENPEWVVFSAERRLTHERDHHVRAAFARNDERVAARLQSYESELAPSLSVLDAARLCTSGFDGVLLAALEERAQYLTDPAFVQEVTSAFLAAISSVAPHCERVFARSNEDQPQSPPKDTKNAYQLRKRPSQARSRELVNYIFRGAERVINDADLDSAKTQDIADAAGVGIGSLYQYFRDRESVLAGLIDWWIDHDLGFVRERAASLSGERLPAFVRKGLDSALDLQIQYLTVYSALFRLLPRLSRYAAAQTFLSRATRETALVAKRCSGAEGIDVDLNVFVVGRAYVAWVRRFAVESPAFLRSDAFRATLHRMTRILVTEDRLPAAYSA